MDPQPEHDPGDETGYGYASWIGVFVFIGLMIGAFVVVGQMAQSPRDSEIWVEDGETSLGDGTPFGESIAASSQERSPIPPEEFGDVAKRWNRTFGYEILGRKELWDEVAGSVAQRLYLQPDTRTRRLSVYSQELSLPMVLSAKPTQVTLYVNRRHRVKELLITFANRGSIHPREFNRRLREDDSIVSRKLAGLLGHAKTRNVRSPDGTVKVYQEWRQDGIRVRYYNKENDYVAVSLTPAHLSTHPRPPGPDSWAGNVIRSDRGDVTISGIPLVRQGYKPYCVPVTIERTLHYLDAPENMFALAAAGNVGYQGCNTWDIFDQASKRLESQGLKIDHIKKPLRRVEDIQASIDNGFPVLWLVHGYVNTFMAAKARTGGRQSAQDSDLWARELDTDKRRARVNSGQYHSVMVVGYNRRTREIAVIDEIGLIWITEREAQRISMPSMLPVAKR